LLVDAFGRIRQVVHRVVPGLTPEQLAFRLRVGPRRVPEEIDRLRRHPKRPGWRSVMA
jgi:hypothetical protein